MRTKSENNNHSEPLSITNENFTFKSDRGSPRTASFEKEKITKEEIEKKLQSPVENHFALTPITNSQSSSPANGFTSQECTNLLQEELDQLEIREEVRDSRKEQVALNMKNSLSVDGLQSPTDENISMFIRSETEVVKSREDLNVVEEEKDGEDVMKAEVSKTLDECLIVITK